MGEAPLIDIRPDHWEIVRTILKKHLPDREVWAFGSRAKWTAKQYSDLDLCILGDEPLELGVLTRLEEDFSESDLPFKVDVVDWAMTAEGFRKIIEKGRVVVQEVGSWGVAGNWREQLLSNLCTYLNRGTTPSYTDIGGILLLNQKCVRDQRVNYVLACRTDPQRKSLSVERIIQPLDILVNSTGIGTLGRVAQIRKVLETATVNSHVTLICPNREMIDPLYLGLVLRCFEPEIEALGEGSTGQIELSWSRLGTFLIPMPTSLDEQRAIAQVLGALDDKIELNRCMSADLEAMARALFKDWFVDFGPVRAKMEGRPAYLAQEIWDLFPDALDDEDKPVGWMYGKLGDYFEAVKGVNYKGSGLSDAGMPLHNLNSIYEGGGYKYDGIKYYTGDYGERHFVKPGDVIVANTEQGHYRLLIGFAAMVPSLFGNQGIISHHIYRLRPKASSPLTAAYLLHLLNSPQMHETVSGYANGTTVNMLPLAGVQQPQCIAPPQPIVAVFDSIATSIALRRERIETESRDLAATCDMLLPKLITGEIRVRDADNMMEAVL